MVVVETGAAAVDRVASQVVPLDPNRHLAFQSFVGVVVVNTGIVRCCGFAVSVEREGDVFIGIGQTVVVGIVVVFHPQVHVKRCWRTW